MNAKDGRLFEDTESSTLECFSDLPPRDPWGINFGGGTNSWGLAIACLERGIKPNWCLFADTGSEQPHTYESVALFENWCKRYGWPFEVVRWIREDGTFESVHDNAIRTNYLPSKAYGLAGCTHKWKIHPMQKWRKANGFNKTVVAIGYDAGEKRRIVKAAARFCDDPNIDIAAEFPWYPLVAWGIDRQGCRDLCTEFDVYPGKSSCFCCPNMRSEEWGDLKERHPDLYKICEQIEDNAVSAGNAESRRLFMGGYRPANEIACACFVDDPGPLFDGVE